MFIFYTSFGDRFNSSQLKSNKFHKMMNDANISGPHFSKQKLDLLFVRRNKHRTNMDFETFLSLVTDVAMEKFKGIHESQATVKLLQNYLIPLYENIYNQTEMGFDDMLFK